MAEGYLIEVESRVWNGMATDKMSTDNRSSLVERVAEKLDLAEQGFTLPRLPTDNLDFDRSHSADSASPQEGSAHCKTAKIARIDPVKAKRLGMTLPESARHRTLEEFRIIKRSMLANYHALQEAGEKNANVILVTSATPDDGKTFTALNLARSFALDRDLDVLLIDTDLRRSNISELFGLEAERGLIAALNDHSIRAQDLLVATDLDRLSIIPAGDSELKDIDLLASKRMKQIVAEVAWRRKDRIVIFDAPPVLATSDSSVLAAYAGQIAFVMAANKTSKAAAMEAIGLLQACPHIGIILNKVGSQFGAFSFGKYYDSYAGNP